MERTLKTHSRDLRTTRGPGLRSLKRQVLEFDLKNEAEALRQEQGWRCTGHSAKTLVKQHDQRIVLIAMRAGSRMMEHRAASAISIHVLSGRVRVHVATRTIEVAGGQLAALDRALSHDVEACEDSTVLLSVSQNPCKGA